MSVSIPNIELALRDVKYDLGLDGTVDHDEVLRIHIRRAIQVVKHYRPEPTFEQDEYEAKYHGLIVEMAVYSWNKRGHDGAIRADENGVTRGYEVGSYPPSMTKRITPRLHGG